MSGQHLLVSDFAFHQRHERVVVNPVKEFLQVNVNHPSIDRSLHVSEPL